MTPQFSSYALGWSVQDYRGIKTVQHGGAVFGVLTMVVMVPDRKVGFALQMNSEDYPVLRGVMNELLDHYLGLPRSEEHTSELQSLMRISYAVFCLKKKKINDNHYKNIQHLTVTNHKQNHITIISRTYQHSKMT